ncbi:MAG: PAS domain S-box protein [Deltaproteobacteria bacterium]|nr:PAS domain S-box protein [Deltaproteobacteria bacterium]
MPRFSLAHKVLTAFIIILLPILLAILAVFLKNRSEIKKILTAELSQIANEREAYILMYLEMNKKRMVDFASDGFIVNTLDSLGAGEKKTGDVLTDYLLRYKAPLLTMMYRLNIISASDGRVLASTDPALRGMDISQEDYFRGGLKDLSIVETSLNGEPEIAITAPIYSRREKGKVLGVIIGFTPLSKFAEFFSGEYIRQLGALSFIFPASQWNTFEIYLVNRDKLMLTESRFIKNAVLKQKIDTPPVKACLEERKEISGTYIDYRGEEVEGASMCFPTLGWTLVAEVDVKEVFAPVFRNQEYALALLIVVTGFISLLVLYFVRHIISNIRTLVKVSEEIAAGDYDIRIPISTHDEIGVLAESFKDMASKIKRRTSELEESQKRLRSILDNMGNIVYLKDLEGRHIFVNSMFANLLEKRSEDIYGKTVFDIFPKEIAEELNSNDLKALESDRATEFEETIYLEDGLHTFLSIKFPLKDMLGRKYAICGVSTDITALKKTEEALRHSQERLQNAQKIAHIGNWELDIQTDYIYMSDEVFRIFGRMETEFNTNEEFISSIHPMDREQIINAVKETLSSGTPLSIDARIIRGDGAERIVHLQGEADRDERGNPARLSGTVQDITERKMAEEEVRKLNIELERRVEERTIELQKAMNALTAANKEIETFTYSVAHDLRSPLRLIDGFSQLLIKKQKDKLDNSGKDQLDRIRASVYHMGRLIDDLLNLYYVMRSEVSLESIDLSAIAFSIITDLRKANPERAVKISVQEHLRAEGDEKLLRMALENLIGNAWKYSSRTEITDIAFGSKIMDEEEVFYVRDNGIGFEMKHAERIFEPFERLHSAPEYPGTGVGLATVRRIIERHGGRVWAESEPGKGSTFYFTLKGGHR